MMSKKIIWIAGFILTGGGVPVQAENLIQVYQAAQISSPALQEAMADNDAAREGAEEAKSALLPQLSLSGSSGWSEGARGSSGTRSRTSDSSLVFSQPLFDISSWWALTMQEKQAQQQKLAFQQAEQTLLIDVANAYFNVLKAEDALLNTEEEKKFIFDELRQTRRKFNAGVLAITDMQNIKAQYDQVLSAEVTAQNNVDNSLERLRELSGVTWNHLATLNTERFKAQNIYDLAGLQKQAQSGSLRLLSARLSSEIAKDQIYSAKAGHMPTFSLNASMGIEGSKSRYHNEYDKSISGGRQVGVSVSIPVYSGGGVSAEVRRSEYSFISASKREESVLRNVLNNVREDFNNINSAVSKINADEQSVISAKASLEATKNGYQAGTRTMLDVLNATTIFYYAQHSLAAARYDYLLYGLALKNETGQLDYHSLQICNAFLGKEIKIDPSE